MMGIICALLKKDGVALLVTPYDWVASPAPKEMRFFDIKDLLNSNEWLIEKEIRDIPYTLPVNEKYNVDYLCHLVIARKIK